MSIFNFQNDLCDSVPAWENIIQHFGWPIEEDQVWGLASMTCKSSPIANIYQSLLITQVIDCFTKATGLEEWDFEHEYSTDGRCAYLMIDGVFIESEDTFWELVKKLKKKDTLWALMEKLKKEDTFWEVAEKIKKGDTLWELVEDLKKNKKKKLKQ